jgi:cbb3-type cytochrome oxidase subunit 3
MNLLAVSEALAPCLLVLMFAIVGGIVAWTYSPSRRAALEDAGRVPFRDDPRP